MRSSIRAVALAALSLTGHVGLGAQMPPSAVRAAVDRVLADAVASNDVPGVVAIVVGRQGILYEGAFGTADAPSGRPMAIDTVFRFYSMTKPITSVAAMQLVEQGKLSLDAPASTYLPELGKILVVTSFDAASGAYSVRTPATPVTLRQLLTQTAGFGYNFDSAIARDFKPRTGDSFSEVLLFERGDQWWYGTNTEWVGRIVERVSGQSLEDYFARHILGPLQMRETYFNVPDDSQPRLTTLHRRGADGQFTATPNRVQRTSTFNGGHGLFSTGSDYARFIRMPLNGGSLDGTQILKPETMATMGTNQIGNLSARALKTAMPTLSSDFSFVNEGRDKFGLGFLISVAIGLATDPCCWVGLVPTALPPSISS